MRRVGSGGPFERVCTLPLGDSGGGDNKKDGDEGAGAGASAKDDAVSDEELSVLMWVLLREEARVRSQSVAAAQELVGVARAAIPGRAGGGKGGASDAPKAAPKVKPRKVSAGPPPGPSFTTWLSLVPTFTYSPSQPFFEVLVPTVDTVRSAFLLSANLDAGKPTLLCGGSGDRG